MSQNSPKGYIDEPGSAHLTRENDIGDSILTTNSGATAPSYALKGSLWLDNSVTPNIMKQYDGTDWIIIGELDETNDKFPVHCAGYAQNSAPSNPVTFTQWLDTTVSGAWVLKIYDGSDWIIMGTLDNTNNIYTSHVANYKQNSAPTGPLRGTLWIDDTATPWIWKIYDGSDWITLGNINATTNKFYVPILDEDDMASDSALLAPSQQSVKAFVEEKHAIAIFRDEKVSGNDGGTCIAGWNTRVLNATQHNDISGASLSSNQFTLPAGTYRIRGEAPGYAINESQLGIYNITDAGYEDYGPVIYIPNSGLYTICGGISTVDIIVTIAGTKTFELRHYCGRAVTTNGFGKKASANLEVYGTVVIEKRA